MQVKEAENFTTDRFNVEHAADIVCVIHHEHIPSGFVRLTLAAHSKAFRDYYVNYLYHLSYCSRKIFV
jgi:uncharacterized membrane protein affecting hemolysin expression